MIKRKSRISRRNTISTALSDEEYLIFEERWKKSGMTVSEYVRSLIFRENESLTYSEIVGHMFTEHGKKILKNVLEQNGAN